MSQSELELIIKAIEMNKSDKSVCIRDKKKILLTIDKLLLDERVAISDYNEFEDDIQGSIIPKIGTRITNDVYSLISNSIRMITDDERTHRDTLKKFKMLVKDIPEC